MTHETASICVPVAPAWFGVVGMVHVVPSQASASVASPATGLEYPTAEHDVMLKQSMPCSWLLSVPALGLATIDQVEPFHCSTSVWYTVPKPSPTAVHHAVPMHETPLRSTLVCPAGFGVDTTVHVVPFHSSDMLAVPPAEFPTPMHTVDDVQETAVNCEATPRPVVGTVWAVQVVPFQLAAVGAYVLAPVASPTAMQKVVLGHDTPARPLSVKPARLGLGTMVHTDPFHCSISVVAATKPTATHSVAVAQLTAEKPPSPVMAGVVTNVQAEPVHCSMSGSVRPPTL